MYDMTHSKWDRIHCAFPACHDGSHSVYHNIKSAGIEKKKIDGVSTGYKKEDRQQNPSRNRRLLAILQLLITPPRPLPFPQQPRTPTHLSALTTGCRQVFSERAQWKTEAAFSQKPLLSRTPQPGVSPPTECIHRGPVSSTGNVRIFYRGIIFLRWHCIIRYDF